MEIDSNKSNGYWQGELFIWADTGQAQTNWPGYPWLVAHWSKQGMEDRGSPHGVGVAMPAKIPARR
jgi:hypothetical protein